MFKLSKQVPIENLISRQINFWETSHKTSVANKAGILPNITLSREPGSRAGSLAKKLSGRLNWKLFGREIVEYISSNTDVHKSIITQFDEKTRNDMENIIATLINNNTMSNEMYFKQLAKTLVSIGRHSNSIIIGRGANFILPDNMAVKVRIVESFESRLQNVLSNKALPETSAKMLKKEETVQADFISRNFKKKIDDPLNYDLIINLSKIDLTTAEELIVSALCKKYNLPEKDMVLSDL